MKHLVCAILDSKVGVYSPPMCFRTKGEAIRSFSDACGDDKLPFGKHPADYRLFLIGEFDDNAGSLSSVSPDPLIGADELGVPF